MTNETDVSTILAEIGAPAEMTHLAGPYDVTLVECPLGRISRAKQEGKHARLFF